MKKKTNTNRWENKIGKHLKNTYAHRWTNFRRENIYRFMPYLRSKKLQKTEITFLVTLIIARSIIFLYKLKKILIITSVQNIFLWVTYILRLFLTVVQTLLEEYFSISIHTYVYLSSSVTMENTTWQKKIWLMARITFSEIIQRMGRVYWVACYECLWRPGRCWLNWIPPQPTCSHCAKS